MPHGLKPVTPAYLRRRRRAQRACAATGWNGPGHAASGAPADPREDGRLEKPLPGLPGCPLSDRPDLDGGDLLVNLDRGIRRIVLAVSLSLFVSGFGVSGYAVWDRVEREAERARAAREAQVAEDECIRLAEKAKRQPLDPNERAKLKVFCPLLHPSLEDVVVVRDAPWSSRLVGIVRAGGETPFQAAVIGILASAGLAAFPWGLFCLIRWIVWGFRSESPPGRL